MHFEDPRIFVFHDQANCGKKRTTSTWKSEETKRRWKIVSRAKRIKGDATVAKDVVDDSRAWRPNRNNPTFCPTTTAAAAALFSTHPVEGVSGHRGPQTMDVSNKSCGEVLETVNEVFFLFFFSSEHKQWQAAILFPWYLKCRSKTFFFQQRLMS